MLGLVCLVYSHFALLKTKSILYSSSGAVYSSFSYEERGGAKLLSNFVVDGCM